MKFVSFNKSVQLAVLASLMASANAGIDSCSDQSGCFSISMDIRDVDYCMYSGGDCEYRVCMKWSEDDAGCGKDSTDEISHTCAKDENVCTTVNTGGAADFQPAAELTDLKFGTEVCQNVPPDSDVQFLWKDAKECSADGDYSLPLSGTAAGGDVVSGACKKSDNVKSCTGTGNIGKECIWTFRTPPCPESPTTPEATTPEATTPEATTPEATTPEAFTTTTEAGEPTTTSKSPSGSSYGDPHVQTWNGEIFDFHGACDLVLVSNPEFANGAGLDVHIRTKIKTWWSYIDTAVLRIGSDTLEVRGGENTATYWINGEKFDLPEKDGNLEQTIAGNTIHYSNVSKKTKNFNLHPARGVKISLQTFNDFVRVNVKAEEKVGKMNGAVGLMGSYPSGKMIDREGELVADHDEFGKEWQVRATEPKLFHSVEGVQHPQECRMPTDTEQKTQRRLGEAAITQKDAELACSRIPAEYRDNCIFDVLATNDKDMAGSY